MEVLRRCTCGLEANTEEDLNLFCKHSGCKYGRRNKCKECHSSYGRKQHKAGGWTDKRKEQTKRSRIKYNYGISLEEYEESMATSVVCEICGDTDELCYDHNHATGEFRGVLCRACNRALGSLKDNPKLLARGIEYLIERGDYSSD